MGSRFKSGDFAFMLGLVDMSGTRVLYADDKNLD